MSLSYRNQSNDLQCKSIDWFLYERDIGRGLNISTYCLTSWALNPLQTKSFTDLFKTEIIKFNMWYISLISTIWTLWKTWKKHPSCGDTFSKVAGFTKSITPLWVFFTFFNCKNGTKSRKSVSYLLLLYLHCYLYYYSTLLYMELIVS